MKNKLLWRFRKRSESGGMVDLECGCKEWVYTHEIARFCDQHEREFIKRNNTEAKNAN